MKLWGGRFTKETDQLVQNFNESLSFDQKFYKQDIQGSMAHVKMLAKQGILTEDEKEKSRQDLQQMLDYVDMLNQLDTSDVEPLTHIFPIKNVFREDVVLESTPKEELLKNAPKEKDGQFLVPKTIG